MDYRAWQEKYGNKLTAAIADQKFIDWLISVLQLEGFGTAKEVNMIDGTNIQVLKTAEDATSVTFQVNYVASNAPEITYSIQEGSNHEWGKSIAAAGLNVDITIKRRTYALDAVVFTSLVIDDKDRTEIDAAGVNAGVGVSDFDWVLTDIDSTLTLTNGDETLGTVVATDEKGYAATKSITINRQDRYIWGICQGQETAADICTQLASETGNIVPADGDAFFLQLTTALGDFPSSIEIDTAGGTRTFFVASMDPTLAFKLGSDIPFPIEGVSNNIDLNSISGGDANVTRLYTVFAVNLNSNFTLYKA